MSSTINVMPPLEETPPTVVQPPSSQSSKSSKLHHISLLKQVGAEFVGTFILVFAATAGSVVDQKFDGVQSSLLGSAASSGVAVMIIVYSIGHISKAHLNPAVTLAYAALGHFPWLHVPFFIVAEVLGSISASFLVKAAYHPFMSGVTVPSVSIGQAFLLEFVATFFLMFVIIAVATDDTASGDLAGVAIGGAVMLGILMIGPATGASMNPARTLGPAIATGRYKDIWIYMLAPPMGAVLGAVVYALVKLPKKHD